MHPIRRNWLPRPALGAVLVLWSIGAASLPPRQHAETQPGPPCPSKLIVSVGFGLNCDLEVGCVEVEPGAFLHVIGHTLTITSESGLLCDGWIIIGAGGNVVLSGGGSSVVNDRIKLTTSTSRLTIAGSDQAIEGTGHIRGEAEGAAIEIAAGATLTNRLAAEGQGIRGILRIDGLTSAGLPNGTLRNEGVIDANEAGDLVLDRDTLLSDVPGATWRVSAVSSARLVFERDATGLEGDIVVADCGAVHVNANVTTCGTFRFNAGLVRVASGAQYGFAGYSAPRNCPNPSASGGGTCDDPWIVSGFALLECDCP